LVRARIVRSLQMSIKLCHGSGRNKQIKLCCKRKNTTLRTPHLDVDASDVTSAKELDVVLVLVDRVVVDTRVFPRVPVKHELAIIQASHSFLATDNAEVALLQLPTNQHIFMIHMEPIALYKFDYYHYFFLPSVV